MPWFTAANCSILSYPATPKPAYFAVKNALRPALFSARIPKFDWRAGERFTAGIWLLNDAPTAAAGDVRVTLCIGDTEILLLDWHGAHTEANRNLEGAQVCCVLPDVDAAEMTLKLTATGGLSSEYRLLYYPAVQKKKQPKLLNQ